MDGLEKSREVVERAGHCTRRRHAHHQLAAGPAGTPHPPGVRSQGARNDDPTAASGNSGGNEVAQWSRRLGIEQLSVYGFTISWLFLGVELRADTLGVVALQGAT